MASDYSIISSFSYSKLFQANIMQILWHIGRRTIEWLMLVSILNLRRIIILRHIQKSSLACPVTRGWGSVSRLIFILTIIWDIQYFRIFGLHFYCDCMSAVRACLWIHSVRHKAEEIKATR